MTATRGNMAVAALLVVAGIVFLGLAVFYAVANTDFLATPLGHHYKHAVACAVVAVVCFIGANFMRPRNA